MIFFKTTPKMTLRNPYTGSEVLEMSFSISADVYSDLTIKLALKNYPKMTHKLPKSLHWFKRYSEINQFLCQLMCSVTSPLYWKTPKWLLNCQNPSTGSKDTVKSIFMSADVYSDFTVWLALKKYSKVTLKLPKSASSKDTVKLIFMLADVYSAQWESALVVRGKIFSIPANITKMLISQANLNGFVFCKKTPKCLSFSSVIKHSPHF